MLMINVWGKYQYKNLAVFSWDQGVASKLVVYFFFFEGDQKTEVKIIWNNTFV